ncbi:MAG: hypothetical protein IJR54_06490 [Oscillibacter sp.]|nr:hypothetical protein [Oscillibacter sp.]
MEKLPVLCGEERVGEAEAEQERLYVRMRVRVPLRRGMWRAWAVGERGEVRIGTLEPQNGESVISRRFSKQSLSEIGTLVRVDVRPAEDGDGAGEIPEAWEQAGEAPLFRTARFRRQSRHVRGALTRTDGDRRRVALVRDENGPFPIPELFCLASSAKIGARDYWVFAFDRQEWPVLETAHRSDISSFSSDIKEPIS